MTRVDRQQGTFPSPLAWQSHAIHPTARRVARFTTTTTARLARLMILIAVTAWISLGGVRTAHAQLDGDAATDTPPAPGACRPNVEAAVKAAVSGITSLRCVEHKTPARNIDNKVFAGQLDEITAHIALADGRTATVDVSPDGQVLGMAYDHNDLRGSSSKAMAVLFWLFALAAVGGALFVISRRNLIAAVMGMVGSFLGIAAIYMLLYAQFLAVVQMLVYAGAIMVLFVFVVMILNRPEDEPVAPSGRVGQAVGGIAILYLVGRLILMLIQVQVPDPKVALAAPLATAEGHDWGSIAAVGTDLFGPGLFPFEAISILLLVAVVGAIAIARPLHAEDDGPAKLRQGGAA